MDDIFHNDIRVRKIKLASKLLSRKYFDCTSVFGESFFELCETSNFGLIDGRIDYENKENEDRPFTLSILCSNCNGHFFVSGTKEVLKDAIKFRCHLHSGNYLKSTNIFVDNKVFCDNCSKEKEDHDKKEREILEKQHKKRLKEQKDLEAKQEKRKLKRAAKINDYTSTRDEYQITFGQHKGKLFTDLDKGYLTWLYCNFDYASEVSDRAEVELSLRGYDVADLSKDYKKNKKYR